MVQTVGKNSDSCEKLLKEAHAKIESLTKDVEECKRTADEYKTKYLRALADYQNFEKRSVIQRDDLIKTANTHLIVKLLGYLDNLEKAGEFIKDKNLKLITDSFLNVLKGEGLKEIPVSGKEFDPYTAEVIDMAEGEKENMVVSVLRKGYEFNGKIIRVAQVIVSKKKLL